MISLRLSDQFYNISWIFENNIYLLYVNKNTLDPQRFMWIERIYVTLNLMLCIIR